MPTTLARVLKEAEACGTFTRPHSASAAKNIELAMLFHRLGHFAKEKAFYNKAMAALDLAIDEYDGDKSEEAEQCGFVYRLRAEVTDQQDKLEAGHFGAAYDTVQLDEVSSNTDAEQTSVSSPHAGPNASGVSGVKDSGGHRKRKHKSKGGEWTSTLSKSQMASLRRARDTNELSVQGAASEEDPMSHRSSLVTGKLKKKKKQEEGETAAGEGMGRFEQLVSQASVQNLVSEKFEAIEKKSKVKVHGAGSGAREVDASTLRGYKAAVAAQLAHEGGESSSSGGSSGKEDGGEVSKKIVARSRESIADGRQDSSSQLLSRVVDQELKEEAAEKQEQEQEQEQEQDEEGELDADTQLVYRALLHAVMSPVTSKLEEYELQHILTMLRQVFDLSFAYHDHQVDTVLHATTGSGSGSDNVEFVLDELDFRLAKIDQHPKYSSDTFKSKDMYEAWRKQEQQRINGLIAKVRESKDDQQALRAKQTRLAGVRRGKSRLAVGKPAHELTHSPRDGFLDKAAIPVSATQPLAQRMNYRDIFHKRSDSGTSLGSASPGSSSTTTTSSGSSESSASIKPVKSLYKNVDHAEAYRLLLFRFVQFSSPNANLGEAPKLQQSGGAGGSLVESSSKRKSIVGGGSHHEFRRLPAVLKDILNEYAQHYGVGPHFGCLCYLEFLADGFEHSLMHCSLLLDTLSDMMQLHEQDSYGEDEASVALPPMSVTELDMYHRISETLHAQLHNRMVQYRRCFPRNEPFGALQDLVDSYVLLCRLDHLIGEGETSHEEQLRDCVRQSVSSRFQRLIMTLEVGVDTDDEQAMMGVLDIEHLVALTKGVLDEIVFEFTHYEHEGGFGTYVDFKNVVGNAFMDELYAEVDKSILHAGRFSVSGAVFELAAQINSIWVTMVDMGANIQPRSLDVLLPLIFQWIEESTHQMSDWLYRAIGADEWAPMDDEHRFSSSVLDLFCICMQPLKLVEDLEGLVSMAEAGDDATGQEAAAELDGSRQILSPMFGKVISQFVFEYCSCLFGKVCKGFPADMEQEIAELVEKHKHIALSGAEDADASHLSASSKLQYHGRRALAKTKQSMANMKKGMQRLRRRGSSVGEGMDDGSTRARSSSSSASNSDTGNFFSNLFDKLSGKNNNQITGPALTSSDAVPAAELPTGAVMVMMNNIGYARIQLYELGEKQEQLHNFEGVMAELRWMIESGVDMCVLHLMQHVSKALTSMMQVAQCLDASGSRTSEANKPLVEEFWSLYDDHVLGYVNETLQMLVEHLYFALFAKVLYKFWVRFLDALLELVIGEEALKTGIMPTKMQVALLQDCIEPMRGLLHADGAGLTLHKLESREGFVRSILEVCDMKPDELLELRCALVRAHSSDEQEEEAQLAEVHSADSPVVHLAHVAELWDPLK